MKRIAVTVCVVVLVLAVAAWAQTLKALPKSGSVEQELIKLENDWNDALLKHNWAFLDGIMAEDYTWTDYEGTVITKGQSLASLKSGEDVFTSAVGDEFKVRVYGDAAVVSGRFTAKEMYKGKDVSGQFRTTDIFIKQAGRWRCVAGHGSKIVQK